MLGCWCCAFRCRDQPEIPLQEAESFSSWLSVVLAGRWHGTLRAGSSLKSLFRRQKVFPLPAPSRQVALCASLGPPCPLRLLTLFPIVCVCVCVHVCVCVGHRVTLCAQGWAEEFILMVCPFKNHCLFKTANCHAGNSSASRPMKTQCFLLTVHWCTCGGVSYTLFFVGHLAEEFPLGAVPTNPCCLSHMPNS